MSTRDDAVSRSVEAHSSVVLCGGQTHRNLQARDLELELELERAEHLWNCEEQRIESCTIMMKDEMLLFESSSLQS
jgi:hypothetical protein